VPWVDGCAGRRARFCVDCDDAFDHPGTLDRFLQTPHAAMPELILSPDDRSDLVAYILSLRP
jgi:hypothetical protein